MEPFFFHQCCFPWLVLKSMKFFASLLMFRRAEGLHLMEVSAHRVSPSSTFLPHLCAPAASHLQLCCCCCREVPSSRTRLSGIFSVCHISSAADAYLLRCHHISVFWAWQPLEMHSLRKEGKDLVIKSLQSEGKPVPSSEALWQLFVASWHLPFSEISPFVLQ